MAVAEKIQEMDVWSCHECGFSDVWTAAQADDGGTPVCPDCDIDMHCMGKDELETIFETDEWKAAFEYAIKVDESKKKKE